MTLPVFFQFLRAPFLWDARVLSLALITITPLAERGREGIEEAGGGGVEEAGGGGVEEAGGAGVVGAGEVGEKVLTSRLVPIQWSKPPGTPWLDLVAPISPET